MNALERRATLALGSIFALRMLGLFMIVPVFAIYGRQYTGATPALLGLAIGIYGLTQAVLQIPASLLADRFARKPLIIIGLLLFALGGAVAALSTHIWGVIAGRAIAGSGAVSAIVMALLADVTREEQRSKAMASMGMTIALSFIIAFGLGPLLNQWVGLSGLFWLTSIAAFCAIGMLALVPTPLRVLPSSPLGYGTQLSSVLKIADLNRLHVSIFMLHFIMTAVFVLLPGQLIQYAHIAAPQHGWVYLPLLLLGFILAIPAIIVAEVKRQMRAIFLAGALCITLAMGILALDYTSKLGLLCGVGLFFIGFNVLEAILPSWLAKRAPVAAKATAMGINASSQFLGAFAGGTLGGLLLAHATVMQAWVLLMVLGFSWLIYALGLQSPPYLSSLAVRLPVEQVPGKHEDWGRKLLAIQGIEEVVVLPEQQVAYLKVDKTLLDDKARHELTQLLGAPIAI